MHPDLQTNLLYLMFALTLLSLFVAVRSHRARELQRDTNQKALSAAQQTNQQLQQQIEAHRIDLHQLNERLQHLSDSDHLTGIRNRRFLEQRLTQEWTRCGRYAHPLALLLIDIDYFRQINDRHGHAAGDACLQQVAQLIHDGLRWPSDLAARFDGEEFCLLLPETDREGAGAVAERIRSFIAAATITSGEQRFQISVSIGVYVAIPDQDLPTDLFIRSADAALSQSRQQGRNRVTVTGSQPASTSSTAATAAHGPDC